MMRSLKRLAVVNRVAIGFLSVPVGVLEEGLDPSKINFD
jgi:hypothetical protein